MEVCSVICLQKAQCGGKELHYLKKFCSLMEAGTAGPALLVCCAVPEAGRTGKRGLEEGCIFQVGHKLSISGLECLFSSPVDQKF